MNPEIKSGYSTFQIQENLGVERKTLKGWEQFGIIPSIQKATGVGSKNLFSIRDCYKIRLFQTLVYYGFPRKKAQETCFKIFGPRDDRSVDEYGFMLVPKHDFSRRKPRQDFKDPNTGVTTVYSDFARVQKAGEYTNLLIPAEDNLDLNELKNIPALLTINLTKIRTDVDDAMKALIQSKP